MPHGWDAGVLFEETQGTLLCSDLFHQIGDVEPLTSADIVGRSHQALKEYQAGILAEYMPYTPLTAPILKKLANLKPKTLAIMHGSAKRSITRTTRSHPFCKWRKLTSRQLVSRARKHIADGRRKSVSSNEQRRFLEAFVNAAQKGDMVGLEILAEDVVAYADGGGLVRAAGVPVSGRERVKTFVAAVSKYMWNGVSVAFVEVNGQAAVLMSRDGVPAMLGTIDVSHKALSRSCGS